MMNFVGARKYNFFFLLWSVHISVPFSKSEQNKNDTPSLVPFRAYLCNLHGVGWLIFIEFCLLSVCSLDWPWTKKGENLFVLVTGYTLKRCYGKKWTLLL